jgi:hypothetical protein
VRAVEAQFSPTKIGASREVDNDRPPVRFCAPAPAKPRSYACNSRRSAPPANLCGALSTQTADPKVENPAAQGRIPLNCSKYNA